MKQYIADTNFYLRFILQDIESQAAFTEKYLKLAELGKIKIFFPDEVILEMEFVLRSFYFVKRIDIFQSLDALVKLDYVDIENKALWIKVLETYRNENVSLIDILLHNKAKGMGAEVLSFDKDFKKLVKKYGKNI